MIDGIKIFYRINDFIEWKSKVKIDLFTPTDLETGEAKGKTRELNGTIQQTVTHRGNFDSYRVTIKETSINRPKENQQVSHLLIIDGSLHKNQFNGENYLPFPYCQLNTQIDHLEKGLQLSGPNSEIVNIEIGVNVILPFPAYDFLSKNLLTYKGTPFNRYNPDRKGVTLGFVCPFTQYSVKVYDRENSSICLTISCGLNCVS